MKKQCIAGVLTLVLALGVMAAAGCSAAPQKEDINANIPKGAAPLMPTDHNGRFDSTGAKGCYGCHGANDNANPMLKGSVALPSSHYVDESSDSQQIDPRYDQCITCHVQG